MKTLCEIEFQARAADVRRARTEVTDQLAARGWEETAETAGLLVDELAVNTVDHTGAPAHMRLLVADTVLIEVVDAGTRPPRTCEAAEDDEGGRGLALVDVLAADWGWRPQAGGRTVRARLAAPAPAAS